VRIGPIRAIPQTDKKEVTDAEKVIRPHCAVVNLSVDGFEKVLSNPSRFKQKRSIFCRERCFFS
jgi:hypothetical protein